MITTEMRKGVRLFTLYNTLARMGHKWVVKVETQLPNQLFEEELFEFWNFDAAYHFVKAKQDEVI